MRALLCAYYERIINSAQGAWEDRLASCGQLSVTCGLGISTSMISPAVLRVSRDGDQRRIVSGRKKKVQGIYALTRAGAGRRPSIAVKRNALSCGSPSLCDAVRQAV